MTVLASNLAVSQPDDEPLTLPRLLEIRQAAYRLARGQGLSAEASMLEVEAAMQRMAVMNVGLLLPAEGSRPVIREQKQ